MLKILELRLGTFMHEVFMFTSSISPEIERIKRLQDLKRIFMDLEDLRILRSEGKVGWPFVSRVHLGQPSGPTSRNELLSKVGIEKGFQTGANPF